VAEPVFLSLNDVLQIHQSQIEHFGGTMGIRDIGLLESAVAMPAASFSGQYFNSTLFEMAAAYLFHICQNHAFVDGNKRTALASALIFLELNEQEIDFDIDPLEELVLKTASGQASKSDIAKIFESDQK